MTILIGPCMFLGPLVFVLALLALPFWPVALVLLLAMYVVTWPIEKLTGLVTLRWFEGWSASIWRVFLNVLRPWRWVQERERARRQR